MEEFSRGMSELGERDLSPDGGLRFGIDLLHQQGPPEPPPPLVSAPLTRGASGSPPAKLIQPEEVRPETRPEIRPEIRPEMRPDVKRPDGQVDFFICFLSLIVCTAFVLLG